MGKTVELDKNLADGLKAAKSKRCYFALVLKGAADGALLVSKTKIAAPAIGEAKKKSGGSATVVGFVSYEDGLYVFDTAKPAAATAAQAVKIIVKRDAELSVHAEFRVSADPELATLGDGQTASGAGGAQTGQPTSSTAQKGTTPKGAAQKPLPEAAKYAAALTTWEQASAAALSAVGKLVSGLEGTGDEVALSIASVIKELQASFPDTLDDALTALAKAAEWGNPEDAETYRVRAEIAIKASLAYLNNNALTIEGCEHNPLGISVPFSAALKEALKQVLIAVKK